jgi:hypothetical protein
VTGAARGLVVATALIALPAVTSAPVRAADGCAEPWQGAVGPLPGGSGPADFGATPEACGVSETSARLRVGVVMASAMPDFYRSLTSGIMLRTRKTLDTSSWLSFAFDAVNHRYIENAGLESNMFSLGPPTLGYHRSVFASPALASAVHVRALLPLDTARANSFAAGLEIGGGLRATLTPRTVIDGGVALVAPADIGAGQVHARFVNVALAEAWYSPRAALALGAGAAAVSEFAPTPALVTIAPRLAARIALRKQFWLAVLVEAPVAGRDRTDFIGSLTVGYIP